MGANVQQIGKVHCPLQLSNSYLSFVQSLSDLDICPILPRSWQKVRSASNYVNHPPVVDTYCLMQTRVNGYIQFDVLSIWIVKSWCKITKNAACFNWNIKYSISLFGSDWVQWVHRDSELDDRTLALHSSFYLVNTWIQSGSVLARTQKRFRWSSAGCDYSFVETSQWGTKT